MKLVSPEEAALLGVFSQDEIAELSASARKQHIRDVVAVGYTPDTCLSFLCTMSAFAFIQLGRVYPGRCVVTLVNAEVPERDGFYRRKAGEEHLFHEDSEVFEAGATTHEQDGAHIAQEMLRDGVNVGQAYSMLPMSAYCKVLMTGTVRDALNLYTAIGKRPGLFHPDAKEAAIDLLSSWSQYAPSLVAALKETT